MNPDPYRGPERRRYDRSLSTSPQVIGRARFVVRSQVAPPANFPTDRWYPVMDRGHETRLVARPGYVWLGLDGSEPWTLSDVGVVMHTTRERVRQIEGRALAKLRHPSCRADLAATVL